MTSGRYQNASEALRKGLGLVERLDTQAQARLKALRQAARAGIADADAGRFVTFNSSDDLRKQLDRWVTDALSGAKVVPPGK